MDKYETDSEFIRRFEYFVSKEVMHDENQEMDDTSRYIAVLATLIGCQGLDAYKELFPEVLGSQVTPAMIKEIFYQSTDYLGYGRMLSFLNMANEFLIFQDINLPLENQETAAIENRLEKGINVQTQIFGEHMKEAWKSSHVNRWLAANCFGDYYARTGLTLSQREWITFCFLTAQGGCEPQLIARPKGNINLGNDSDFLMGVVSQCLPYIGYSRSLNAIRCIKKALEQ